MEKQFSGRLQAYMRSLEHAASRKQYGEMAMRQCGSVTTWLCGILAIWQRIQNEAFVHSTAPSSFPTPCNVPVWQRSSGPLCLFIGY